MCADAGLLDKNVMKRTLIFYNSVVEYLLMLINKDDDESIALLSALPEWYIEDVAEFLLFMLQ